MYKTIIFDMDGVLVDSQPFHFAMDKLIVQKGGGVITDEQIQTYAGMSSPDRFAKYVVDFKLNDTAENLVRIHSEQLLATLSSYDLEPNNGVLQLLEMLKEKGLKLAVASSSSRAFIEQMLEKLNIIHYFEPIVSGEELEHSKPSPDIFLLAAELTHTAPSDCIVIEDAHVGVLAAKAAGMKCIGYINKNSGAQDLSQSNLIVDDFHKLVVDTNWIEK